MSGRYKETYHSSSGAAKLAPRKGKRKALCDDDDNSTPGPSSLSSMATSTPGVMRQLPNLAPKPTMVDPPTSPLMERESTSQRKRLQIDQLPESSSQFLQQTFPTTTEHTTAGSGSNNYFPNVENSLVELNALSMADVSQGSMPPTLAVSGFHNTSQAETSYAFDFPLTSEPSAASTIPHILQMSYPQASAVGFCPRCHVMWRNLRHNIMAFTFGQGGAGGGVVGGELLQSYFGLEDHWKDGHDPGVARLAS
ncbi:hypothetical protein EV426DRAFT_591357 [Tirmania nivea]|nr:hypothetical protein EV426DRAFT_591357 [Tirmania nivea]